MPVFVRQYGGDTLSAVCIFWGVRWVLHRSRLVVCAGVAFLVCVLIELQQLIRWKWLVSLRNDTPMGILLGHGWLWTDIVCYAVGVGSASAVGLVVERRANG
jgi:Protein of unknown function (DUF2809)